MASISPPTFPSPSTRSDSTPHKFTFPNPRISSRLKRSSPSTLNSYSLSSSHYLSRFPDSALCRCSSKSNESDSPSSSDTNNSQLRWDSVIQDVVRNAIKRFNNHMSSYLNQSKDEEKAAADVVEFVEDDDEVWDWDRWSKHFNEVDEQERIRTILKAQLAYAIGREDYEDASRLKVAIAAAATNDTVGRVMYHLDRAIKEERYGDAALIRDSAGAGLVGWWAGISEDANDPYGRIIRITAEHGRYMAKSYSPRQLATASAGIPLFEIFLTVDQKGDYMQQAVYLRRTGASQDFSVVSPKSFGLGPTGTLNPLESTEDKTDLFASLEDSGDGEDRDDDSDKVEGFSGFDNILRDMVPGVKVKVMKVTTPEKVDRDVISKVIEQIMEEEDEDNDIELDSIDTEDEDEGESDQLVTEIDLDTGGGVLNVEGGNEISVKVVVGGLAQRGSDNAPSKKLIRQPAKLEKRGRLSFSFSVEKDDSQKLSDKGQSPQTKKAKLRGPSNLSHVVFDLAKSIGKGKIPMKVLKDVNELINLTLKQAQNRQLLSGSTTFNRIETPTSLDPLSGLYIGTHGLYSSEVIHLRRKFGQWKADGGSKEPKKLEFYEYVEAMKLTGDAYVPAGQVAFRAKVGKRFQLPHKGIIPEEFGVVARYKGQGRLAEPGFVNPRWVDGELVILDGKYIKGGPVVGFLYWAPEYHFLVFFNRLRLQE